MKKSRHTLVEIDWPEFGTARQPAAAGVDEFRARLDSARKRMAERRLTHLVVYGDREHFANLAYLTNFDPRFEEAVLVLDEREKPLLIVGNECEGYLPISPLWQAGLLRKERYQPFSLLDQPRDSSRLLGEIFRSEGIEAGAKIGCVGWKYYREASAIDVPSYIVDALRGLAGPENVVNATDLFTHPDHGLRADCSAAEIARFEYANVKASEAMRRMHFALRPGISDYEWAASAPYDGTPLGCHMTLAVGSDCPGLAGPSGRIIERGQPLSTNVCYWGSNTCRAGWIAESEADLPREAHDYVRAFAGPYFEALAEWFDLLRIGQPGGRLESLIQERLPFEQFGIFLNCGHLIHLDEWLSSPIYPGSEIPIRSGMVMQVDVIPSSPVYGSTRMEDGVAIADPALRSKLRQLDPECYERCQARRRFVQSTLRLSLPEEVLPLSNMACIVPPFLLRPNLVFALEN